VADAAADVDVGGFDVEVGFEFEADVDAAEEVPVVDAGVDADVFVGDDEAAAAPYNCCRPVTSSASSVRCHWLHGAAAAAIVAPMTRESSNPSACPSSCAPRSSM